LKGLQFGGSLGLILVLAVLAFGGLGGGNKR
jgi:hypothetical protein